MKFGRECYVAAEGKEVFGLISLAPDGGSKNRLKINRLILKPGSYDTGKCLIDYAVNKFGGAGTEIFLTAINENYTEAITLFKKACSFRNWSKIHIREYENLKHRKLSGNPSLLRPATNSDTEKLYNLDAESLYPQFRTAFAKTKKDFKFGLQNKLIIKLKKQKAWYFVLDNPDKNSIEGFLSITTQDNTDFWADITLSPAYREYCDDILNFAINHVSSENKAGKLYLAVRDYRQTSDKLTEILSAHNFKQHETFEILIKDYWKPIESSAESSVPIIIFPDRTSPACMFLNL